MLGGTNSRKGLAQTAVVKIVGILLIGAIVISVIGSIGSAIADTGDALMDFTGTNEHVDVEEKHTFISASRYVYDRAWDCEEVEQNIYPGLEDTDFGEEPRCAGVSGTAAAYFRNMVPGEDTGGDMEGRNSRITFEISEDVEDNITISSDQIYGDEDSLQKDESSSTTLDDSEVAFRGVSDDRSFYQRTDPERDCGGTGYGNWHDPGNPRYFVAFDIIGETNRVNEIGEAENLDSDMPVYCEEAFVGVSDYIYRSSIQSKLDGEDGSFEVVLCPGDEGYIQANKDSPWNEEEAAEDHSIFPFIEITTLGEDCVGHGFGDVDVPDKLPDDLKTSGRLLHVTGDSSEDHPYVRGPGLSGGATDYAFDLFELSEENTEVSSTISSKSRNIDFGHNPQRAEECVLGLWNHHGVNPAPGWVSYEQGTAVERDGTFPDLESEDVKGQSLEDRNYGPDAEDLYNLYAQEGFVGGSWGSDISDKILNDFTGEQRFETYGDLLCAPDKRDEAQDFENDHATWYMCGGDHGVNEIEINEKKWVCDEDSGAWLEERPEDFVEINVVETEPEEIDELNIGDEAVFELEISGSGFDMSDVGLNYIRLDDEGDEVRGGSADDANFETSSDSGVDYEATVAETLEGDKEEGVLEWPTYNVDEVEAEDFVGFYLNVQEEEMGRVGEKKVEIDLTE